MARSILTLLACTYIRELAALLLKDEGLQRPINVLVFGDSWGALGPSYTMMIEMFKAHSVPVTVKSTAVSGTTACQWAFAPGNLAIAALHSFPLRGPDFVWLTLGGNDLLLPEYVDCNTRADNLRDAMKCSIRAAKQSSACNIALLEKLFESYPKAQVVQCGYDFSCMSSKCLPNKRWAYCKHNVSCYNLIGHKWASQLMDPLTERFPRERYSTVAVDGACQKAVGMPGADVGHPNMRRGSPCRLFTGCDHPAAGSIAAFTIGEAFWDGFFKERITGAKDLIRMHSPVEFQPVPGWQTQISTDYEDVQCNKDWVPNLSDLSAPPPPCNRTIVDVQGISESGQGPDPAELEIVRRAESDKFDTFY